MAFYVGPSSNALDIDFKDGAVSDCGTAFYIGGGLDILLDNNLLNNKQELYTAQATGNVTFSNSRSENSTAPTIYVKGNGLILNNNQFAAVQGSGPDIFLDATASRVALINNYSDSNSDIGSLSPGAAAIVFSSQNSWPNCKPGSGIPDWTAFNRPISDNLDNCTRWGGAFGTARLSTVFNTTQFTLQPTGIASNFSTVTPRSLILIFLQREVLSGPHHRSRGFFSESQAVVSWIRRYPRMARLQRQTTRPLAYLTFARILPE
jgi:hypothetical protein